MRKNFFRYSILASLFLHLVLALVFWVTPQFFPPAQKQRTQIEFIDLKEAQKLQAKKTESDEALGQIVDQNEKALNDEVDPKTKYLSRHNQVVERQTRAELSGKFQNTPDMGGRPQADKRLGQVEKKQPKITADIAPKKTKNEAQKANESEEQVTDTKIENSRKNLVTNEAGLPVLPSLKDLTPSFKIAPKPENFAEEVAAGGGRGPSASDDHLDVPKGMQTLLSTREFIYFAYYNRIKGRLRQYWEPKIKEKMAKVMREGRTIASTENRLTKVIIVLNKNGALIKVQVLDGSGVKDLDDAALEAFRAAAPFPNPPKGIIEEDGTIKIRWDFILEA